MLNSIGQTQYINRATPKQPKRVAHIERLETISKDIEYKSGAQLQDCCKVHWHNMATIMYCRKTKVQECPVCRRHYEVTI